jgi:hypothetical protein
MLAELLRYARGDKPFDQFLYLPLAPLVFLPFGAAARCPSQRLHPSHLQEAVVARTFHLPPFGPHGPDSPVGDQVAAHEFPFAKPAVLFHGPPRRFGLLFPAYGELVFAGERSVMGHPR